MGEFDSENFSTSSFDEIESVLKEKEHKLSVVEREIAGMRARLQEFQSARYIRAGEAFKIRAAEVYRRSLNQDLQRKIRHRDLVLEEVKKAREKLEMLTGEP